jgi:hypothetical protein
LKWYLSRLRSPTNGYNYVWFLCSNSKTGYHW